MNPTDAPRRSQAQNGYGRIPDYLWPTLLQLSPPEAKLFLLLCSKANRKREPLGVVDANISNIAMVWMHTSPGAIRRYLKRLDELRLIDYVYRSSPGGGGIRVTHYRVDQGDPYVDHCDPVDQCDPDQGDPVVDHSDPIPDQGDPGGGSQRSIFNVLLERNQQEGATSNDKSNGNVSRRNARQKDDLVWFLEDGSMGFEVGVSDELSRRFPARTRQLDRQGKTWEGELRDLSNWHQTAPKGKKKRVSAHRWLVGRLFAGKERSAIHGEKFRPNGKLAHPMKALEKAWEEEDIFTNAPCKRDHTKDKVHGRMYWYCPDGCGWKEPLEVRA